MKVDEAGKQLYDLFDGLTRQLKDKISWEELPEAWRRAWIAVVKKAKSLDIDVE